MTGRFGLLDLAVLVAYLAGTTALGMYIGRRQKGTSDYFVGNRNIPWWAVLFSIVATETSALTFISIPGLAYVGNLGFLQVAAGYILGRIGVAYLLLPRYFQGDIVTAYAMLEQRFGRATRRLTSIVFMVTRAMADSVRVFATAIPVALILGSSVPRQWVMPAAILVLGALTILYTYRGGMRAVVWTELLQASVYVVGGLSAVVLIGMSTAGGWSAILASARAQGKLQLLDFSRVIDQPHTVYAGLIGGAFLAMASHGADQLIVQRLLSCRSLRDAQRAIIGSGVVVFLQFTLFLMVGIGLWGLFGGREFATPDSIFPTFIIEQMPTGLTGLLVAAIIAATMSTHSGAINSLAAATTHDIYIPLSGRAATDPVTFRMGRRFALVWGVVLTAGALLFKEQGTPVVVVALGIASFTLGGLLGAFFLGNFWARAEQRDAILGLVIGIAAMSFVVFAKQLSASYPSLASALGPLSRVAWPWYVLIGTSITVGIGMLSSFTHPLRAAPAQAHETLEENAR
ncbi:MAG: Sodium/glucose cotransporter [Gemmatimonadaceae bacterium]|nr:Sodium/glucose cotransporter [Gemmatimonadaceae bacterium]